MSRRSGSSLSGFGGGGVSNAPRSVLALLEHDDRLVKVRGRGRPGDVPSVDDGLEIVLEIHIPGRASHPINAAVDLFERLDLEFARPELTPVEPSAGRLGLWPGE
jgi:hypothetical protein